MNTASIAASDRTAQHRAPMAAVHDACTVEFVPPVKLLADTAFLAEWDALACVASEPNAFSERWYCEAALKSLDSAGVRIAVVRDDALVGIIPLLWQNRYAGLPVTHVQNWLNHNAFLGTPLVRKGAEQEFWNALLAKLDRSGDGAMFLHLTGLATEGTIATALASACDSGKRRHAMVHHEERALLEKGLSPDAYLETTVRAKKRKELRRQHKRLSEEGVLEFQRSEDGDALGAWIDEFFALEKAGWKGANGSALACAPETATLFRSALKAAAAAGKLERLTLRLNGRAIAMLVNFLTAPGSFSFKTAFDEEYSRFSPGVLIQIENLALLAREGIDWCDSCAAQDHPMIDSLWSGRRAIGRYSVAIGGAGRRMAFAALLTAELAKTKLKGNAGT